MNRCRIITQTATSFHDNKKNSGIAKSRTEMIHKTPSKVLHLGKPTGLRKNEKQTSASYIQANVNSHLISSIPREQSHLGIMLEKRTKWVNIGAVTGWKNKLCPVYLCQQNRMHWFCFFRLFTVLSLCVYSQVVFIWVFNLVSVYICSKTRFYRPLSLNFCKLLSKSTSVRI